MNRVPRSIALVLSAVLALEPVAASASNLRYFYNLSGAVTTSIPGVNLPPGWTASKTTYGDWTDTRSHYDCSNWSPSTSSIGKDVIFTQTATDCKQDQERWAQTNIENTTTGQISKVGDEVIETRTINVNESRQEKGILESWLTTSPTFTPWVNTDSLYGCTSWTPNPATYSKSASFTQTSSACKTDQERQRQAQEREENTGAIRDIGSPVKEERTLPDQVANRNYSVELSDWKSVGAPTSCTNWSPAQNTIEFDVEFTQTATDCSMRQERTRVESYVDHISGKGVELTPTIESQILTGQTSSQRLKGTKIPLALNVAGTDSSFSNSPFLLSWTAAGANEYLISSDNQASGVSTSNTSLGITTSKQIIPPGVGNFTYTVTAKNNLGETLPVKKVVAVEASPSLEDFTVNGVRVLTVSPGDALAFKAIGLSAGATLVGRNSDNTANASMPNTASATAGTVSYYAAASKTVNGVTKNSEARSVSVTTVNAPAIQSFTAPAASFDNETVSLKWSVQNATSYKIHSNNAASGVPISDVETSADGIDIKPTGQGAFVYRLTATNAAGVTTSATVSIAVEGSPAITSFTSNPANAAAGSTATLAWVTSVATSLEIDQSVGAVTGTSKAVSVGTTAGTKTYKLTINRTVNGITRSASATTSLVIVAAPSISPISGPSTNVFVNNPFTLAWTGSGASNYSISGSTSASGIANEELGTSSSKVITPSAAGTYTYTVKATNSVGVISTATISVTVEDLPSISTFTASPSKVAAGATATLTWATSTANALTIDQNVGAVSGSSKAVAVGTTAGEKTYTLTMSRTLNGVTKTANKAATLTVVAEPTVSIITAPATNVFVNSPFTLSWSGTDASSYSISGSTSASGIANEELGTSSSKVITPTTAGTYTYTVEATNSVGVISTATRSITVEELPSISTFTASPAKVAAGATTTLAWATSTVNATSIDQNVGAVSGTSKAITVGAAAGDKTYTLTVSKTLNGITKTASKATVVTVVAAPTVSIVAAPSTNVFVSNPFSLQWAGADIVSYSINANAAASGISTTLTDVGTSTSRSITPSSPGTYTYTITAVNSVGVTTTASKTLTVEALPSIGAFSSSDMSATAGDDVTLDWTASNYSSLTLDQSVGAVSANSKTVNVGSVAGGKTYTLTAAKALNGLTKTDTKSVTINVVAAPTVSIGSAPSTSVFQANGFSLGWSGTGVTSYVLSSNNANSGVATTGVDLGTATSRTITPTSAGTYVYTITAKNALGAVQTATKSITVESLPVVSDLTATPSSVAAGANTTLTWTTSTASALSIDQGVGAVSGTSKVVAVGTAAGSKTYTLTMSRTLNGVTLTASKAVAVTVVAAPTISISSAPTTNVFAASAFTLGWSSTGAVSYAIRANAAESGVSTADISLGTATSRAITPTAPGTYTYTITATNAVGATTTDTETIVVEAAPTISSLVTSASSVTAGGSAVLTWATTGSPTLSIDQAVGAVTGTTKQVDVGTAAGTQTFVLTATKTLNGVTKTDTRSVSINVIAAPTVAVTTSPSTNVFVSNAFTLGWSGTGATSYTLSSNNASSGIAVAGVAMGTATSRTITPTAVGTYDLTVTATNSMGDTTTTTKSITVEALPTISQFVASPTSVNSGGNTTLTWTASTGTTLAIDQSVGAVTGTSRIVAVGATPGAKAYTLTASRTLNGVTKTASKSASVTVISGLYYNPLTSAIASEIGVSGGKATSRGTANYLIYGPYSTTLTPGNYTLTIYGTTSNALNTTYDIVRGGGTAFIVNQTALPSNASGVLLSRTVSIPQLPAGDMGIEIRVRVNNAPDYAQITGYTLIPQ